MKQLGSSTLGFLLALTLGMTTGALAAPPGNGSPVSTPPANGTPSATTPPSPTLSDLGRSLRSYFSEEELDLLFQYMRDSVIAAFKGEEVTLPPDLSFKLEILLVRMKKEGGHYMDNLIKQLEKDLERNLKEKLKEKLAPPDTSTSTYAPPTTQWVFPPLFLPPPAMMAPASPQQQQQYQPQYRPPSPPIFSLPSYPQQQYPPIDP